MAATVLLVDDDEDLRELVSEGLRARGFTVYTEASGPAALERIREVAVEVVLTDLEMPEMDGLELARQVEAAHALPVVVLTGQADLSRATEAIRAGVFDFLQKPVRLDVLALAVERAVQHRTLTQEVRRLRDLEVGSGASRLLGKSRPMQALRDLVRRVAPADVSVLVTGESGTGKEVVARALHAASPRAEGPFVPVNCAAVPESLLESELFGHEAGAFTGASAKKQGLFVKAKGGTLFLDEIGEMPVEMQVKLLRALQEQRVRPVGATEEVDLDVRLVTATNRDLEEEVEEGRFREDLYYRINVVHVAVPPLRARGSDVLLLAQHFITSAAADMGRAVKGLMPATADKLLAHAWPGNVRELENAMQRACALARYDEISVEDLPERIREVTPRAVDVDEALEPEQLPTLAELERRHMLRVLEATEGNKTRAARILGVDRRTLYRKAERYGLEI